MRNTKYTRLSPPSSTHPQPLSLKKEGSSCYASPDKGRLGRVIAFPATGWTRSQYSLGFTLVELIVVVTILAILATIGFVSYSSYLTGVRDTNRIAQMTSLSDGLNLYSTRNDLPIPEDNVEVSVNSNLIAYQGYAGANILETINFEKGGVDPKDNTYFSYYLTRDRKYFQLMGFLEESADLTTLIPSPSPLEEKGASIVSLSSKGAPSLSLGQTQGIQGGGLFGLGRGIAQAANYQNRIPTVTGKKLGILTDVDNNPVQEDGTDINITGTSPEEYKAYLTNDDILVGSGSTLVAMNPKASCKRIRETTTSRKNGVYTISPDGTEIEVYCDMTTDGGGWTALVRINPSVNSYSYWRTNSGIKLGNYYNYIDSSNLFNIDQFYVNKSLGWDGAEFLFENIAGDLYARRGILKDQVVKTGWTGLNSNLTSWTNANQSSKTINGNTYVWFMHTDSNLDDFPFFVDGNNPNDSLLSDEPWGGRGFVDNVDTYIFVR